MTAFAAHPVVCDNSYLRARLSLSFCSFHSSCPTLSTLNHACSAHRLISSFGKGRVRGRIKRLENTNGRQMTYAKRKHSIMKKANELSLLCDIDIVLLMFSPTGKPSSRKGKRSIDEVIVKFAQITPQERAKRFLFESLGTEKYFQEVGPLTYQNFWAQDTIEDPSKQSRLLQNQLSEVRKRLNYWTNPDEINNMEHLGQLENLLRESLNQIRAYKVRLSILWDVKCSVCSSFVSYSGLFNTGKTSDLSTSGQQNSVNGLLNELNGAASLRLQLAGQYPFFSYNLNLLNVSKFQPAAKMNLQESNVDFLINGSFETPKSGYDTTPGSWASTSGPSNVTMFDEHLYSQHPN